MGIDVIAGFWIFWVFGAIFAAGGAILLYPLLRRFPAITAAVATALVILGTFTACGPEEGTVVEKTHIPDLSYWTVGLDAYGKVTPVWVYNPECWELTIHTPADKFEDTCVNVRVYHSLTEGDYWKKAS